MLSNFTREGAEFLQAVYNRQQLTRGGSCGEAWCSLLFWAKYFICGIEKGGNESLVFLQTGLLEFETILLLEYDQLQDPRVSVLVHDTGPQGQDYPGLVLGQMDMSLCCALFPVYFWHT